MSRRYSVPLTSSVVFTKLRLFIAVLVTALSGQFAQASLEGDASLRMNPAPVEQTTFQDSNWFFYVSTGVGRPSYDGETQTQIDAQKARGGGSPEAAYVEIPGVYRKLSHGLAVGAILAMGFENVSASWKIHDSFAVQTFDPSLSVFEFLSGSMGQGWFGRLDLGASRIFKRFEYRTPVTADGATTLTSNEDGFFGQIAVGYGWKASRWAQVLVHLNGQLATAGPSRTSGLTLNVGFLL